MEEDIKILEEFIKYFEAEAVSIKYRRNISITVGEDDIEALKNLIKGYRELEEWKREKGCSIKEVYALFIPKSKIEDKIEELKETADEDNLKEGLHIIEEWGFKYKTLGFSWIKLNKKNRKPFFRNWILYKK